MATIKTVAIAVGTSAANSGSPVANMVFSGQPAANDRLVIGTTTFTFVASGATGNQINIGANLAATLANATTVINANATESPIITASNNGSTTLTITSDTTGPANNAYVTGWTFASATINHNASGAATSGSKTLAGGGVTLTGGMGYKTIEVDGDGSIRFTTAGGQRVAIRDIDLNKLLFELLLDEDSGLGPNRKFFGIAGTT